MFSDLPLMYWEIIEEGGSPLLSYFSQTPEIELSRWDFNVLNDQMDMMMDLLRG